MGLNVKFDGLHVVVSTDTAQKFYGESALWFALKKELNTNHIYQGEKFDLVKKVMSKDGHLVGGDYYPFYLRDRKHRFCIHDAAYALRDISVEFNNTGAVQVLLHHLI